MSTWDECLAQLHAGAEPSAILPSFRALLAELPPPPPPPAEPQGAHDPLLHRLDRTQPAFRLPYLAVPPRTWAALRDADAPHAAPESRCFDDESDVAVFALFRPRAIAPHAHRALAVEVMYHARFGSHAPAPGASDDVIDLDAPDAAPQDSARYRRDVARANDSSSLFSADMTPSSTPPSATERMLLHDDPDHTQLSRQQLESLRAAFFAFLSDPPDADNHDNHAAASPNLPRLSAAAWALVASDPPEGFVYSLHSLRRLLRASPPPGLARVVLMSLLPHIARRATRAEADASRFVRLVASAARLAGMHDGSAPVEQVRDALAVYEGRGLGVVGTLAQLAVVTGETGGEPGGAEDDDDNNNNNWQ